MSDMDEARRRLLKAWRGEIEARYVYEVLARRERDPRRSEILRRIADAEAGHRRRIEQRLTELGVPIPDESSVRVSPWLKLQARLAPVERLLRAREAAEDDEALGVYGTSTGDPVTDELLRSLRRDERAHSRVVEEMADDRRPAESVGEASAGARLHRIVAGVSGATGGSSFVLTAGLAGAVASAVSMGVGAWLAARSEAEMAVANLAQERRELEEHPGEEREELSLFYQLKGLSKEDADQLVDKLARSPEVMLQSLVAEELGGQDTGGNPWTAALAGLLSTAVGAIIPVLPFFFVRGTAGVLWAAGISLLAHFVVGAAKSLVTLRTWWGSGLEMTAAGVLVGGVTYALGIAFRVGT